MARKTSRQAIEKRINIALNFLSEGDLEESLYNIAPAIDATAKERNKNLKGVGNRIKAFIRDEQDLLYYLSMQGLYFIPKGVRVVMVRENKVEDQLGDLADFIYQVRCAQSHDAEIDYDRIDLSRNFGIGREGFKGDGVPLIPGQFIISKATALALILSVICAPENKRLKLFGRVNLLGKLTLERQELVGDKKFLMHKLKMLFAPINYNMI